MRTSLFIFLAIAALGSAVFAFSSASEATAQPQIPVPVVVQETPPPVPAADPGPLPNERAYIYINRAEMMITLYKDGDLFNSYPVASIRDNGSKFDTPAGLFEILTKEDLHFSSIGEVWMPFAMQFKGDFFIHGWPYYPDGEPVATGYSGGCVRLQDDVAEAVFNFAEIGMPVLIE